MSLFYGSIYLAVRDLDRAADWYHQKLGTRGPRKSQDDSGQQIVALDFDARGESGIWLGTQEGPDEDPILFVNNIQRAYDHLKEQGVAVGEIRNDEQGNSFFEFQDPDGNRIEVCKEAWRSANRASVGAGGSGFSDRDGVLAAPRQIAACHRR